MTGSAARLLIRLGFQIAFERLYIQKVSDYKVLTVEASV